MSGVDEKCTLCAQVVEDGHNALQCDCCDKWTHYDCVKEPKSTYAKLSQKDVFFCSTVCKRTFGQRQSQSQQQQQSTVKCALEKQEKMLKDLKQSIMDLTANVKHHNRLYEDIRNDVNLVKADVESIRKNDIAEIHGINIKLSKEIFEVKSELNIMKQEKLFNNIICFSIPYKTSENLQNIVHILLSAYDVAPTGILKCHRIASKLQRDQQSSPPIVITKCYR